MTYSFRQSRKFKLAHTIARQLEGDYKACFKIALEMVEESYSKMESKTMTYHDVKQNKEANNYQLFAECSHLFCNMADYGQVSDEIINFVRQDLFPVDLSWVDDLKKKNEELRKQLQLN